MKNEKKPLVWVRADSEEQIEYFQKRIKEDDLDNHLRFKFYQSIEDTLDEAEAPGYIAYDIAAMCNPGGTWDTMLQDLKSIVSRLEAVYLIYSNIEVYAEDAVEEIKEAFIQRNIIAYLVSSQDPEQWWSDIISKFENLSRNQ
jgi:hypothetical protein